ncbi:MAG: metal ABC transporter substrate-binding protein [bacterium]
MRENVSIKIPVRPTCRTELKAGWVLIFVLSFFLSCPRSRDEHQILKSVSSPLVLTTLPDLADWVREVGGDSVTVHSLLAGGEEPHSYEPSPIDAEKVKKARLVVRIGLGLDEWLDGLIQNAGNKNLRILTVSEGIEVIEDEDVAVHKEEGHFHTHEEGNPHIWLDPEVAKQAVQKIGDILTEFNPQRGDFYRERCERFLKLLDSTVAELQKVTQKLTNRKFLAMHESWPYFCRTFGFEMVRAIEPLPGQEPSAKDFAQLVETVRKEKVRAIVVEPQHNRDLADALARETGAKVVVLASVTGSLPEASDYVSLLKYDVEKLAEVMTGR